MFPAVWCLLAGMVLPCAGLGWDGLLSLLGYTRSNYDTTIKTVYVPAFKNDTPYKWKEEDLRRHVVREIEAQTPYKVVSSRQLADTELVGKITSLRKQFVNAQQVGETRQAQVIITAEILWRDLRPGKVGEVLSAPRQGGPGAPLPGQPAPPTLVTAQGTWETELGGTQAETDSLNRLAVCIVSLMEVWP